MITFQPVLRLLRVLMRNRESPSDTASDDNTELNVTKCFGCRSLGTECGCNPFLRSGWIHTAAVRQLAAKLIASFKVQAGGPDAVAKSLSGGNLQKFIVGREIDAGPKLLVVSQPTWGVDVGAAAQIRGALLKLRDEGCALLVVSEELEELFEISDRLLVIAQGRVSPSVPVAEATVAMIGERMSGLWDAGSAGTSGVGHAQA
jgi:simple sugar transport system ATP-binding protein